MEHVVLAVGKVFLMSGFTNIGWRDLDYSAIFDLAVSSNITFMMPATL